jgi:hypothetical protein
VSGFVDAPQALEGGADDLDLAFEVCVGERHLDERVGLRVVVDNENPDGLSPRIRSVVALTVP